ETDDPEGPYGAKEAGQGPLLPVIPAVNLALQDALGVWIDEIPVTPEKVLRALEAKAKGEPPRFGPRGFPSVPYPEPILVVPPLKGVRRVDGHFEIGATVTLAEAAADPGLRAALPGFAEAAGLVSSPPLRNAGTVGGNLCVDTRCNYYNMTYEWRKSIGFCLKKDGDICLVAPSSPRCWAVSSSDTAPAAMVLGASVVLVGPDGERELPVAELYRDDGIEYLAKQPHEVVTAIRLPAPKGLLTAYVKLRRRGSIDFPLAGAAVALTLDGPIVTGCRIA